MTIGETMADAKIRLEFNASTSLSTGVQMKNKMNNSPSTNYVK
jgi:hypothetical protein